MAYVLDVKHTIWQRIEFDTKEQMLIAAEDYSRTKDVTIKGEMLNDKWITEKN